MLPQLGLIVVMIGSRRGLFDGAVHALDLAVGSEAIGFGQAAVDAVESAGDFIGMSAEDFLRRQADLMSAAADPALLGEVKCVPLSVSTAWILEGTISMNACRKSAASLLRISLPHSCSRR